MVKKTILFTLAVCASVVTLARQTTADAVYMEQTKEYTLNKDGSWAYHYNHKLQLNSYYAFQTLYGEDFIVYDPAFQKLKINQSVTTMADGKQIASPENAYNELLPGFAANIPYWNRLREMVVTHTGLERGAVIDFDYTLSTAKGYAPALTANELFMMNSPVQKLTFIIRVPAGASFNYEQFNIAAKPVIEKQNGKTTYTWVLNDVPAALREDFKPREQQNRPRIVFTASPKPLDLIAVFASQEAFRCEPTSDLKAKATQAIAGIDKPLLKALKLQEMVANDLNNWLIPMQYTGYKLRPAATTWQSNGGTEAEKAVLLATLLRTQNIEAVPVSVMPAFCDCRKTVSLALIEHTLVKVNLQGMDPLFLSPTQQDAQDERFQLAGKKLITLVPGKIQARETLPVYPNIIALTGTLKLSDSLDLSGIANLETGGRLNPWLKMQQDTAFITALLSGIWGNGTITEVMKGKTDTDLSSFGFHASSGAFAGTVADLVFLKIPMLQTGAESWHMTELLSSRVEPLEIPFPLNESYDFFISIPEGMKPANQDMALKLDNEFGNLEISVSAEGQQLHVVRKLNIVKTLVPVEKYEVFKNMINTWYNKKYREIVLKKGK